jgi:hypothetical protein
MSEKKKKVEEPKIVFKNEIESTFYSNVGAVGHREIDFFLDFGEFDVIKPNEVKMKIRVLMSPQHVKKFLNVLKGNVEAYEKEFGYITTKETSTKDVKY